MHRVARGPAGVPSRYPAAAMASVLNTVRDLDRLRVIVGVLVRHGFGEVIARAGLGSLVGGSDKAATAQQSTAVRLRLVLQDLGPSFVKLGQIVSTRPDLVPGDVIAELKKLQDNVPPLPFAQLRAQVEEAVGAPLSEVFETFDERPLASASIGQVHRARLKTPSGAVDVVVKIQRPNIEDTIARDMDLLYWLARAIERGIPESKVYQPVKLVEEFERAVKAELDYMLEADNAARFARNFRGSTEARFPAVYRDASSRRVLCLEFLPGRKVYDVIAEGWSGERIARTTISVAIKQIFEDGFFHADPHPGNILVLGTSDQPVLGLIDLGLVGRLTQELRDKTIDLMVAVAREDHKGIADALHAIGRPTRKVDRRAFDAEVAMLADKYLGKKLADIELSALLRDLVSGAVKYGIEIPSDFLMVGKALMTIEGVGKEICPELDVFQELKPYFLKLFWARYSPEKLSAELARTATRIGGAATELPLQLQDILEEVREGRLVVRTRDTDLDSAVDLLGRRLYSGLVVGAMLVGSAILLSREAWITGVLFLAGGLTWGSWHVVLAFLLRRRQRRR
jgi:ubiquinone biosynthesis protein